MSKKNSSAPTELWNDRLALALTESGMNVNQVALAMGRSPPAVAAWFGAGAKRAENITGENLLKVCHILNVRPEWVLFRDEPMRSARPVTAETMSDEMKQVVEHLIQVDEEGGEFRSDALYVNRLLLKFYENEKKTRRSK